MDKIKKMTYKVRRELIHMNKARRENGMKELTIAVRKCCKCGCAFESTGNRRCVDCQTSSKGVYLP